MKRTILMLLALLALWALPAQAQQPAGMDRQTYLEEGQKLYKDAGDCDACHGWNGTGRAHDHIYAVEFDAGGPSLMLSKMNRDEMIEMISCGRVNFANNQVMPQYRPNAWTPAHPCWGKLAADIPQDERPVRPSLNLTPAQIEAVVDYVQDAYQGKLMSWDWCSKFFDDFKRICEVWRDYGAQ